MKEPQWLRDSPVVEYRRWEADNEVLPSYLIRSESLAAVRIRASCCMAIFMLTESSHRIRSSVIRATISVICSAVYFAGESGVVMDAAGATENASGPGWVTSKPTKN